MDDKETMRKKKERLPTSRDWIVLDGSIQFNSSLSIRLGWIEKLLTLIGTETGRKLCLANGDYISVTDKIKFFVETDNVKNASPAVLYRFTMITLDQYLIDS